MSSIRVQCWVVAALAAVTLAGCGANPAPVADTPPVAAANSSTITTPPPLARSCAAVATTDSSGSPIAADVAGQVAVVHDAACRHDYDALARLMTSPFVYGPDRLDAAPDAVVTAWRSSYPSAANLDALAAALARGPALDQGGNTFSSDGSVVVFARTAQPGRGTFWSEYRPSNPAVPATTTAAKPTCPPSSTLVAAYNRANAQKATSVGHILCSGMWAGASARVADGSEYGNAYAALFRWSGKSWVWTDRTGPCTTGAVPPALEIVCNSS